MKIKRDHCGDGRIQGTSDINGKHESSLIREREGDEYRRREEGKIALSVSETVTKNHIKTCPP